MGIDDLKLYSVKVGEGSGVLFQPMNKLEYTYILTAKHNLYIEKPNERGVDEKQLLNDLIIYIQKQEVPIKLELKENDTYFPHKDADIAILKIAFLEGYEKIYSNTSFSELTNTDLCGYPGYLKEKATLSEKYNSFKIDSFKNESSKLCRAQLIDTTKEQTQISGFSGGGIMKIENNTISLFGIQSEVTSQVPNGEIEFVPIKYFDDIINYPENKDKLWLLLPPYMGSFIYLKDKAFNIDAGIDDEDISFTRAYLKSKANEVITSGITPIYIKEYFKERLLLNESESFKLNNELIYLTWLEFICIINIAKDKGHCSKDLEDVFNTLRLIYRDTDANWQDPDFLTECILYDYPNLKIGGTVMIKTNKLPIKADIRHYKIDKESIIPRIDYLKNQFEKGNIGDIFIDNASNELKEFAFEKYNFIHFEYIKEFLLVANSKDYSAYNTKNIEALKDKLKKEYGKLFSI
ncbi:ABC-three component system protein [Formosa undariae]|uniref:ABC-three component system protein n=1 Tax=Formosa undariae TaxID=1325436 RepID=A0ABV5EYN9_9FLAO